MRRFAVLALLLTALPVAAQGNRFAYLDDADPYFPHRRFPKLTTPQWIGEPGVEAAVVLAIDDMRDPKRYEAFLRPILRRLQKIDGRAPVSIMTCSIDPNDPRLQAWLKEGLSLEVHTVDHPCPYFKGGFAKAKDTTDRCVDLLSAVPGNRPVAFRMPCCDSMNTPSPRHWAEVFNKTTAKGNYLTLDSSVFNVLTSADPELPRAAVLDGGAERFTKYLPADRRFVNVIENYPYPYLMSGGLCWQMPCATPSDWQAQHLHKPNNPLTVRDWKAALDCTVAKKGVFCLVFHPHNWIKPEQVVELIDHAVTTHGKKVKFLTFKEAHDRLLKNVQGGVALRAPAAEREANPEGRVQLLDLDGDGYLDVVTLGKNGTTRLWQPKAGTWRELPSPPLPERIMAWRARFGVLSKNGPASLMFRALSPPMGIDRQYRHVWHFGKDGWTEDKEQAQTELLAGPPTLDFWLRDLDGDGVCELLVPGKGVLARADKAWKLCFKWTLPATTPVQLPPPVIDHGIRFVDLAGDGKLDAVFANEKEYGAYLFMGLDKGWTGKLLAGKAGDARALPPISRKGTNNGCLVRDKALWWLNEDTVLLKNNVARRSFTQIRRPDTIEMEPGPKSPAESLKCLKPRPGFTVELMAAEPLVMDPIAFAWGADAKLWVVEMGDYPLGAGGKNKPGGRVKFLTKSKDDGPYDRATLFLDGLKYPTGVLPYGKGVLVTCAPDIFYAEDTDGDGKADKKDVLYTGFGEGNQQHRVNGLVWGLDNWIYGANGDSGGRIKSTKTGAVVDIRGRDFRIRPWTGALEAQTGPSQFGRCRDDWGNWFGCNNSNPLYHFALDDHYLRRNPHVLPPDPRVPVSIHPGAARVYPVSQPLPRFNNPQSVNHFTSACSAIVYRDDLFGPAFAGNTFVCEPVHNLIHREVMTPRGVTFTSRRAADEQTAEFLASTDVWFRPTMVQTGPDGALWVADMYRYVIEHPEWIPKDWQKKLDLRAGHDKGRIYRVYPIGKRPRAIPRLDTMSVKELVAALESPNGWTRDTAQRRLVGIKDPKEIDDVKWGLRALLASSKQPQARFHALHTLSGLDLLTTAKVYEALKDPHPSVRRHAIALLEDGDDKDAAAYGWRLGKLIDDPDPFVRLQLASTLGTWGTKSTAELLAQLLVKSAGDRYLLAAGLSSINKKNASYVFAKVAAIEAAPPAVLAALVRLSRVYGTPEDTARLLVKHHFATLKVGEERDRFLRLAEMIDAFRGNAAQLVKLLEAAEKGQGKKALNNLQAVHAEARRVAADPKSAHGDRVLALRLLGRGLGNDRDDYKIIVALLTPRMPDDIQIAAMQSLARSIDPRIPDVLLAPWRGYSPALRAQVLDVLLSRPAWAKLTVEAVQRGKVPASEIATVYRQRLLDSKDANVRTIAVKVFAASSSKDRNDLVNDWLLRLPVTGDATRGAKHFTKTCAACHRLGTVGQAVGPDLASVGDKSPQGLLTAILDPNRAVEARYVNYLAITKDGRTFAGMIQTETSTSITLVGPDGKTHPLLRSDLDELTSTGKSVMPEGLEKDLTPQDAADLIAFVRASAAAVPRKCFAGNEPITVKPGADGRVRLFAKQAAIYGPSLVLEKQYANLGYWQSADDHAVWTLDLPRGGTFAVWIDHACANDSAGGTLTLQASGQRLTYRVQGTGSWDNYRRVRLGTLQLGPGRHELTARSAGPLRSALLDLREVQLTPVPQK